MKCPLCGAWSEVLDTREGANCTTRRRRVCANSHRFTSVEVYPSAIDKRNLHSAAAAARARMKNWARDQAIIRDQRTNALIAADWNITEARVRQIRKKIK